MKVEGHCSTAEPTAWDRSLLSGATAPDVAEAVQLTSQGVTGSATTD